MILQMRSCFSAPGITRFGACCPLHTDAYDEMEPKWKETVDK